MEQTTDIKKDAGNGNKNGIEQKYRSGRCFFTVFKNGKGNRSCAISLSYKDKQSGETKYKNLTLYPSQIHDAIAGLKHFEENFCDEANDGIQILD